MRLLNVESFELVEFLRDDEPQYAIASHRWGDREATFLEVRNGVNTHTTGYQKVVNFAEYVKTKVPSVKWLWIDTCCINKESAAELSEAINLMFEWYKRAEICLGYLGDVETIDDTGAFYRSEWFERGWTLQELLAPRVLVFLTRKWEVLGHKGEVADDFPPTETGSNLEQTIAARTRIPAKVLRNYDTSTNSTIHEKLAWMDGRKTLLEEDKSYALYGILGVSLGTNYGEREKARDRLLAAIHQLESVAHHKAKQYREIAAWISTTSLEENHNAARKDHQPGTGEWLLRTDNYRNWKLGSYRHLWTKYETDACPTWNASFNRSGIYENKETYEAWKTGFAKHAWIHGKTGSGKTILCSTIVEDIREYCKTTSNAGQAIFYFSFTDQAKQSYESLIRSMVAQLGWKEPAYSLLKRAYERPDRIISVDELQQILSASVASYYEVFLHMDGLDECSTSQGGRSSVLSSIERLVRDMPNIRTIVTSRDYPQIRSCMEAIRVLEFKLDKNKVDPDIRKYVLTQLAEDYKLQKVSGPTKILIEDTLTRKAEGS